MFTQPLFRAGGSALEHQVKLAKRRLDSTKKRFEEERRVHPSLRVELHLTPARRLSRGDQKLREILRLLDGQGVVRHDDQITFHNVQIRALLPLIYAEEWKTESERVMAEYGMVKKTPWVLIFARRRLGKTYSVAILVNALLLVLPDFRAVVISTGGRISSKLRETCRMLINNVEGAKERVYISGEDMFVRALSCTDQVGTRGIPVSRFVSILSTYPSDAESQSHHFSHIHHHSSSSSHDHRKMGRHRRRRRSIVLDDRGRRIPSARLGRCTAGRRRRWSAGVFSCT